MGTKILGDIHNDLKLLITAITGFEDGDDGFRICERFVVSNIKHHRYLSVDSHATKRALDDVTKKFFIHGKYKVAHKFDHLVNTFLTSFDFEHHPQYDLQWSLLCLLLNLSNETNKSNLKSLKTSKGDHSLNLTLANESRIAEDIDWGHYLKEGQEEFFDDYRSSDSSCGNSSNSDSEWSDADNHEEIAKFATGAQPPGSLLPVQKAQCNTLDKSSDYLIKEAQSRKWLENNVQNTWWTELEWRCCETDSQFLDAHLCDLWNRSSLTTKVSGTLSEYQACRELVWMFHAPSQMAIFQKNSEANFTIRDNLSIPSLTPHAFRSILSQYCEFYAMINEIDNFGKCLYHHQNQSDTDKLPPLTYEEYNSAISEHLVQLRMGIVEIEKNLMKQDDCHTFLTLSRDLEKYIKSVRMIYDIHRKVIIDWREVPNWECTTKLLSGLYQQVQNSNSRERTNLCASIYLSCLTVYLNIIATWFNEGRLEDWRSEFIIARIPNVTVESQAQGSEKENIERSEKFTIRQLDDISMADPVLKLLYRKARHMGRSIELLVTLDRISDMWKMTADRDASRTSLNDEFLNEITLEFSKYNPSSTSDTIDAAIEPVVTRRNLMEKNYFDIDDNIMQQVSIVENPFLMKAFEEYLPNGGDDRIDAGELEERENPSSIIDWGRNIFNRLERISPTAVLPFRKVLENCLEKVIDQRYSCASKLVKDILMIEYKLDAHLRLMRSVYMMERGHTMTQFYRLMFHEVESSPAWHSPNSLTCIIQEVLCQEWPESSSRWSIKVDDVRTHQVLQAADRLTLSYSIGWPVNMVLTEDSLAKYNAVFCFQLKLKWALWTLNNLRFRDLEGKAMGDKIHHFYARRLESLRFWLIHAIGSIHAYLAGQVLQGFGIALDRVLAQADNLDTIITVHNEYLEKVYEHCLQTNEFEDLMVTINNLLGMCVHVRDRWKRGATSLVGSDLDLMEQSYTKYHTYIALALHNAVQNKEADYHKLTPFVHRETQRNGENSDKVHDYRVADLSRNLLMEVAHQSLPPSGIHVPVPTLVQKRSNYWIVNGLEPQLPEYVSLNQYDQIFSYIRWYHYEQHFFTLNRSPYDLSVQLAQFITESTECESETK